MNCVASSGPQSCDGYDRYLGLTTASYDSFGKRLLILRYVLALAIQHTHELDVVGVAEVQEGQAAQVGPEERRVVHGEVVERRADKGHLAETKR